MFNRIGSDESRNDVSLDEVVRHHNDELQLWLYHQKHCRSGIQKTLSNSISPLMSSIINGLIETKDSICAVDLLSSWANKGLNPGR